MSNQSYYFINYSRKEFSHFKNNIPIIEAFNFALKNNRAWINTDDIRIGSEITDEQTCLKYLDDLRYKYAKCLI